jgi:hypothetical protein
MRPFYSHTRTFHETHPARPRLRLRFHAGFGAVLAQALIVNRSITEGARVRDPLRK